MSLTMGACGRGKSEIAKDAGMVPCPDDKGPFEDAFAGSVSASPHLLSMALSQPDEKRTVGRRDMLRNSQEPVYWELQLPPNRDDATGMLPKTYFVTTEISNGSSSANSPIVEAYFWGDGGDVLKIETRWVLPDKFPRYLQPGGKLTAHLDTDGYTSMLLSSAKHTQADVPPGLHLVMIVRWSNSAHAVCVQSDLPPYLRLDETPTIAVQFQKAPAFPALKNWEEVNVRTADGIPQAGWGPPALLRNHGDERSAYAYFRRPPN
jgi:hypothetical protein